MAWLTCETGSHDSEFLGHWLAQQHQFFTQISSVRDSNWVKECLAVLNRTAESAERKLVALRDQLVRSAFTMCGVRLAVGEAALILRTVKTVDSEEVLRSEVLGELGSLLLSPVASSHVSQLRADVSTLHTANQSVREKKENWTSTISAGHSHPSS